MPQMRRNSLRLSPIVELWWLLLLSPITGPSPLFAVKSDEVEVTTPRKTHRPPNNFKNPQKLAKLVDFCQKNHDLPDTFHSYADVIILLGSLRGWYPTSFSQRNIFQGSQHDYQKVASASAGLFHRLIPYARYRLGIWDELPERGAFLDCPFTTSIIDLVEPSGDVENNGGHTHSNPGREFGELQFQAVKGRQISGNTNGDIAIVTQKLPQFGGRILTRIDEKMPVSGGWYCLDSPELPCLDRNTFRADVTVDVRVPRLASLPSASGSNAGNYTKDRQRDDAHKDENAYYGLPGTIIALPEMARLFRKYSGEPLSINDMSLPKGGRFDVDHNWVPVKNADGTWTGKAHGEHRIGLSADINRRVKTDGSKMPCLENRELRRAVDLVIPSNQPRALVNENAAGRTMSRLYCEPSTFQHIDFDGIPVLIN